ncbi:MAG: carbonic anhydrase [Planctomycetota bacterium]|jgi:carbonic anhydrase
MIPAGDALQKLREGNARFTAGARVNGSGPVTWTPAMEGQRPFAVVLGCADSRVPVEHVFDQGLGDLFVIRVAGNVVEPSQMASIEYAAGLLGTRLVVVLGHTHCGAIAATTQEIVEGHAAPTPSLAILLDHLRPSVNGLLAADASLRDRPAELSERAIHANVITSVAELRRDSAMLADLVANDGLVICGAEYDIENGVVTWLGDPPAAE